MDGEGEGWMDEWIDGWIDGMILKLWVLKNELK